MTPPRARFVPGSNWLRAALLLGLAFSCRGSPPSLPRTTQGDSAAGTDSASGDQRSAAGSTRIEIVDVDLRLLEDADVHVAFLMGRVSNRGGGDPVVLDDPEAYEIETESASTWISWEDLSRILNDYTFGFDGAPIGDLEAEREEDEDERDRIEMTGNLKSALGLAFEIEGVPEVMPDGRIRIRTESIQALDIPVGGLMHALGLDAEDVIGNLEERGVTFDGDDLILDATHALPPPRMNGRVTALAIDDDGIALTIGERRQAPRGDANHLWFRGGTIRIGRMTQTDADLRLVDADPGDPFDFFGGQMNRQLVAGYSKLRSDGGLVMFIPDFEDIERP